MKTNKRLHVFYKDRLAIVGSSGVGALTYQPELSIQTERKTLDFRQPSLDYHSLMKLTKILTRDHREDVESMFRRMCFNVFAHNCDDHSKNFAFLFDDKKMTWKLSPAYDMTYSSMYYGEHTTSVDGNGRNPGEKELLAVGMGAGLSKKKCQSMLEEVRACINQMLVQYL